MFIFDFTAWPDGRDPGDETLPFDQIATITLNRATVMNAHLACLYTALLRRQNTAHSKMVLSPADLVMFESLTSEGMGFGDMRVSALALSRYPSTYAGPPIADWRVVFRGLVIQDATVEASFQQLAEILQHPAPHALLAVDLHLRSSKAYEDHNYSLCLVTAWAVIEKLLRAHWDRYLEQNRKRTVGGITLDFINADRKRKLTRDRDFTASVISEILSLQDLLPHPIYQEISDVRSARNDWLHELKTISREDGQRAIHATEEVLRLVDGIDLCLPANLQLHW